MYHYPWLYLPIIVCKYVFIFMLKKTNTELGSRSTKTVEACCANTDDRKGREWGTLGSN